MKTVGILSWNQKLHRRDYAAINLNFSRMVEHAGALPLMIPVLEDESLVDEYLEQVDGVLLIGGNDVTPFYYKAEAHFELEAIDMKRDRWELAFFHRAREVGKPILGICRGMHLINVALGGNLNQHLPDNEKLLRHRSEDLENNPSFHSISNHAGSFMDEIYGKRLIVNSMHHQGISRLAKGLRAVSWSEDGIIEAVEHEKEPIWAVQYHPEFPNHNPEFSRLFDFFVKQL